MSDSEESYSYKMIFVNLTNISKIIKKNQLLTIRKIMLIVLVWFAFVIFLFKSNNADTKMSVTKFFVYICTQYGNATHPLVNNNRVDQLS